MDCKTFCTALLREARKDAQTILGTRGLAGWVKGWYTESSRVCANKKWFWVKDRTGGVMWEGTSCCSYHAKYRALNKIMDQQLRDDREYDWDDRPTDADDHHSF